VRPQELFDKFQLGAKELENVEERVSDEELLATYFMIVGAFSRTAPPAESVIKNAMDVWHGYGEIKPDKWIVRTIKGRAHLNRLLLGQAQVHGLAFLNTETGEIEPTIAHAGKFNLVDRKEGTPQLLALSISISKDKGRAAGKGQAFHYNVVGGRLSLESAVSRAPELPLTAGAKALPAPMAVDPAEEADELQAEVEHGERRDAKREGRKPAKARR
jgi:hypothetical protein